jgi:Type I phosphodiesterase / nucleotide pyrophosphatase
MRLRIAAAVLLLSACAAPPATLPEAARPHAHPLSGEWLDMFARGYFPGRSGQVFVVPREGDILTIPGEFHLYMHGSPWDYDTRIPLLFWGPPFVRPGVSGEPAVQQDVAPTLGALIGAPALATYTGRVLPGVIAPDAGRPRIALLLVLDAMRADYFERYAELLPTLTRLRHEGAWFDQARTNVLPTVTGVGHANIGTGSEPRFHGIAVNNTYNRITQANQQAYNELDVGELLALTLADAWNLATDGRALIIGQGGAIRATAGIVGHGACLVNGWPVLAASYNPADTGWETNPACYLMSAPLEQLFGSADWGAGQPTDVALAEKTFRASSHFQQFEAEALLAVMEYEALGQDDVTDLVLVNIKAPDYSGHRYGPDSTQLQATLAELDLQLERILALLEEKAGPGRSVVVITADHGMPGEPAAGRRWTTDALAAQIDAHFGPGVVLSWDDAANSQLFVDTARLGRIGVSLDDVADFLTGLECIEEAFTEDEVRAAQARLGFTSAPPAR